MGGGHCAQVESCNAERFFPPMKTCEGFRDRSSVGVAPRLSEEGACACVGAQISIGHIDNLWKAHWAEAVDPLLQEAVQNIPTSFATPLVQP